MSKQRERQDDLLLEDSERKYAMFVITSVLFISIFIVTWDLIFRYGLITFVLIIAIVLTIVLVIFRVFKIGYNKNYEIEYTIKKNLFKYVITFFLLYIVIYFLYNIIIVSI